jgi:WD40 repeat protein
MPTGHSVSSVKFSPDDRKIVAFSVSNNAVAIINVADGSIDKVLNGYTQGEFTPDGKYLMCFSGKNIVKIDMIDYSTSTPFETAINNIQSISIANNELIACIVSDGNWAMNYQFQVWNYNSGKIKLTKSYKQPQKEKDDGISIRNLKLTKDGDLLLAKLNQIYIDSKNVEYVLSTYTIFYGANTMDSLKAIKDGSMDIYPSQTGRFIAFDSRKNNIAAIIYETNLDSITWNIPGINSIISDIAYSPDDKYIALAIYHLSFGRIEIWDINLKLKIFQYQTVPPGNPILSCDISNDNNLIVFNSGEAVLLFPFNANLEVENRLIQATITYPNPAHSVFNLEFYLTLPNKTIIDLIDLTGNTVKIIDNTFLAEGNHQYSVNIADLPVSAYTLRINSGNFSYSNKIIKN